MQKSKRKAVIFDMDGVLVDSEPVIEAAAIAGLAEYGVQASSEDFIPFIGAGEDRYIGGVAEKYGVKYEPGMKARVYEIYQEIIEDKLKVYDGTIETLNRLKDNGYVIGLASSADFIKIDANLRAAKIDRGLFTKIISGDDVKKKKPFPDIYLKAAQEMGMEPVECIVVEDAVNGIRAAKAAGMKCIAVTTSFPAEVLKKESPDYICSSISGVYDGLKEIEE